MCGTKRRVYTEKEETQNPSIHPQCTYVVFKLPAGARITRQRAYTFII